MTVVLDPEGAHAAAVRRLADFRDARVLEIGCGEGRLTFPFAAKARSWLALDPDEDKIAAARRELPRALRDRVRFVVAPAGAIDAPATSFDLVFFSWSL